MEWNIVAQGGTAQGSKDKQIPGIVGDDNAIQGSRWREDLAMTPPLRTSRRRWCFGREDIKKHRRKVRPLQIQTTTLTPEG